jgi:hypothetical protein
MGIEQTIISAINELIYFDIFEGFIFLCLFLIDFKIKLNKKQLVFHVFMLGVLDYLECAFATSALLRIALLGIVLGIYMSIALRQNIFIGTLINIKNVLIFLIIETGIDVLYGLTIHVELLSMDNNFKKFIIMIPVRIVEFIFIYYYYKLKGGKSIYEKNDKNNIEL